MILMKFTAIIASALVALLITGCASTQTADTGTPSTVNESSKHMPYYGTIMAIDKSAGTVTIQTDHGTMMMGIYEGTKFDYRGGSKTLSDFNVGDKVSGMMMMGDSGKMMVVSIKPYNSKA